jgi:hypothetical protein
MKAASTTTTLTKGAASTQTQTIILENVPQTSDQQIPIDEQKKAAKIVQTKKLATSKAVVTSHHMGVNTQHKPQYSQHQISGLIL